MGKESRSIIIRKDRDLQNVSPFSYKSTFADRKREARYSMGERRESSILNTPKKVPAVGTYSPIETYTKQHAPEYKIGTQAR
jgi:hypothetical protein